MSDELVEILKEAARLAEQASEAARNGDTKESARLQKEAEVVWYRVRRLSYRATPRPGLSRDSSARDRTVAVLTALRVPSSPKQIAAYAEARSGERFDVRGLASIRRDEQRSWKSGSRRDVYVVPALEGPWFVAGRGRFALSTWPLWQRIVGPLSPRADHLRAALQLISIIESADRKADLARLHNLLVEYARTVPGALIDPWNSGRELELERVRSAVKAELDLIGTEDEESRKRDAERAMRNLSEEQQLWGGGPPQVVVRKAG